MSAFLCLIIHFSFDAIGFSFLLILNPSGMEGGPVFGEHAHLIGIFIKPLRQKASGAEVQVT